MLEPTGQVLAAAERTRPSQTLGPAMRPPTHHVIGYLRMELQANSMPAITVRLVGEIGPAIAMS